MNFFANDAPYSFDYALMDLGVEFYERTKWERPNEDSQAIENGPIIAHRRVSTRSKLPAFVQATLAEYTYNKRTSYLIERTDSSMRIKEIMKPSGFPYAEQVRINYYIEVYQPFADVR